MIAVSTDDHVLGTSPAVQAYFGPAYESISRFADMLSAYGEQRGLIGPREVDRLWERHILNCAALAPFIPATGLIADIGSGAGLPGIIIAMMRPDQQVILIEPMERRTIWLEEVVKETQLSNVDILRGRSQDFFGSIEADVVTARAVANLAKLMRMAMPLVKRQGHMIVLKGKNVSSELDDAAKELRKFKGSTPEILQGSTVPGVEATTVVRIRRG